MIIVRVPAAERAMTPRQRVASLQQLRAQVNLSAEQVEAWNREVRAERDAWRLPEDSSTE